LHVALAVFHLQEQFEVVDRLADVLGPVLVAVAANVLDDVRLAIA
jgi:hypothetical protein